ncbi:hypothetical protein PPACK8108_LOCUS7538 [Phakopsora pachyrhizi]|uniref:Uncharacterized protein n=1 Tax=Phakopsora pachyrhizi TaxID=170000 RepID=A0AAV0AUV7_PHAPC|nr:hypothetical protein PPACK8108_LOCUS7538 [Phakopsora pachyrhizi]
MYDDDQMATKDSSDNQKRLRPNTDNDDSRSAQEQVENPSNSRRRMESGVNLSPMLYNRQACYFTGQSITNPSKEASLGIVWSNCINQRVMLIRTVWKVEKDYDKVAESGNVAKKGKRNIFRVNQARIFFSPFNSSLKHHPKHHHNSDQGFMGVEGAVDYFIDSDGIIGLS